MKCGGKFSTRDYKLCLLGFDLLGLSSGSTIMELNLASESPRTIILIHEYFNQLGSVCFLEVGTTGNCFVFSFEPCTVAV